VRMGVVWVMLWVFLPPAIAAWLLATRHDAANPEHAERRAQVSVVILVGIIAAATVGFRLLAGWELQQTAALFIGIPAMLATAAVFIPARSAKGVACKAVTIGLLISLVFLAEGVLCVLMSAPLFYLVALLVGAGIDASRRSRKEPASLLPILTLMSLMPMSLEGVVPIATFRRETVVSETRVVQAPAEAVAAAILERPRFDRPLPSLLAKGFPRPVATSVDGDTIRVEMRGGETRLNGMEPRTGTLVLERVEARPGFVRWRATSDDSHMRHFLTWQSSEVEWHAIDANTTGVTWSVRYRRDLDPAWYFGPMERYAVRLAAGYLIESVATP
jgi:hypothetical protein